MSLHVLVTSMPPNRINLYDLVTHVWSPGDPMLAATSGLRDAHTVRDLMQKPLALWFVYRVLRRFNMVLIGFNRVLIGFNRVLIGFNRV